MANGLFLCLSKRFSYSCYRIFSINIFLLGLSACASLGVKFEIDYADRDSLNFTGPGSATGIMLDGVMDGAGVAIGIAIDQGIAKDISNNILRHDPKFDFRDLLRQKLNRSSISGLESIKIQTYGFKSAPGKDLVSAWLKLDVVKNGTAFHINYPDDFADIRTEKFVKIKENASIAVELLIHAIDEVIKRKLVNSNHNSD